MSPKPTVIYAAGSLQQAYLLKNALVEAGIEAVVANEVLEQGSGVDVVGWSTLARVVVDEKDALVARQIAMEYDRRGASAARDVPAPQPPEMPSPGRWPCCPQCGRPRVTRCRFCQTTGSDFPEADPQYAWGMGSAEGSEGEVLGSCTCPTGQPESEGAQPEEDATPEEGIPSEEVEAAPPLVLRCPTCDEPFVPQFSRCCTGCGHRFADGVDLEAAAAEQAEQIGSRVVAVIVALGLLAALLIGWFLLAVRDPSS